MEYESLVTLSYIAAAASVVFLIVGAFLFFKLKIRDVIGELTGSKQRKAIENIKANNNSNARKTLSTGGKASQTEKNSPAASQKAAPSAKVERDNRNTEPSFGNESDDGVTEVLGINVSEENEGVETSVLGVKAIDEDYDDENVTSVLGLQNSEEDEDENVTSVLGVQSIDENQNFEDGITFVHGKTIN